MAGQKTPEQDAAAKAEAEPEPEADGYIVTGAAVVLRTEDGVERYLYRGAPIGGGMFSEESIAHAVSVGLIEKQK